MTKQEEIKEGIRMELTFSVEDTEYWEIGNHFALKGKAITKLLEYLHSQGVVISTNGFYSDLMEPLIKEPKQ